MKHLKKTSTSECLASCYVVVVMYSAGVIVVVVVVVILIVVTAAGAGAPLTAWDAPPPPPRLQQIINIVASQTCLRRGGNDELRPPLDPPDAAAPAPPALPTDPPLSRDTHSGGIQLFTFYSLLVIILRYGVEPSFFRLVGRPLYSNSSCPPSTMKCVGRGRCLPPMSSRDDRPSGTESAARPARCHCLPSPLPDPLCTCCID